jgi:hypothetical protein
MKQHGAGWTRADNILHGKNGDVRSDSSARSGTDSTSEGGGHARNSTTGTHESLVPILEDYLELAQCTFVTFDEDLREWGRDIRIEPRGQAFVRLVDQAKIFHVNVKRSTPGHLALDPQQLREFLPELLDEVEQLKERNFATDLFQSPAEVDRQMQERIERVVHGRQPMNIPPRSATEGQSAKGESDPFA